MSPPCGSPECPILASDRDLGGRGNPALLRGRRASAGRPAGGRVRCAAAYGTVRHVRFGAVRDRSAGAGGETVSVRPAGRSGACDRATTTSPPTWLPSSPALARRLWPRNAAGITFQMIVLFTIGGECNEIALCSSHDFEPADGPAPAQQGRYLACIRKLAQTFTTR